jgi:solute carrier family 9 (sodium/hydrogen exchanger), member 6/7
MAGENTTKKEMFSSWAIFISITLLIIAFFTSYIMQQQKITAVHETVISIFAGASLSLCFLARG